MNIKWRHSDIFGVKIYFDDVVYSTYGRHRVRRGTAAASKKLKIQQRPGLTFCLCCNEQRQEQAVHVLFHIACFFGD